MALSGLQRSILSLYRECLREIRKKPKDSHPNFLAFARAEFRKNAATVDRRDFAAVEYLLRRGKRQLELYSEPGIKNISR